MTVSPLYVAGAAPPTATAYCDVDRALSAANSNGAEVAPFASLQAAYDAGARNLICAPGTYGTLTAGAGLLTLTGNQIDTVLGALNGSGGLSAFLERMVCGPVAFTDNNDDNFAGLFQCEMAQGPTTYSGGLVGGHGQIQCILCDFGDVATFANFHRVLFDSYSEWQFFSAGGIVTSTVAGPISLLGTGLQGNALILVDENETLASSTSARYVLPATALTQARTFPVGGVAAVGQIVEVDSYNNSGHTATFQTVAAATLATDASSQHATRYRFICTNASGPVYALQSQQRLG